MKKVVNANPEWINNFSRISSSLSNYIEDKSDCQTAKAFLAAIIEYRVPVQHEDNLIKFIFFLSEKIGLFGLALWVELIMYGVYYLIFRQCSGDKKLESRMFWFFDRIAKKIDSPSVATYFENSFVV